MNGKQPLKVYKGTVVEVFSHTTGLFNKHDVVTIHEHRPGIIPLYRGHRATFYSNNFYSFLYVRNPRTIEFGDILMYNSEIGRWFLCQDKHKIPLTIDTLPDSVGNKLVRDRISNPLPPQTRLKIGGF